MKRVAIIGNQKVEEDNSIAIDECDEVVRFSTCEGHGSVAGNKTTVWVTRSNSRTTRLRHKRFEKRMRVCVNDAHTAYILYGFSDLSPDGTKVNKLVVDYDPCVVHNLCDMDKQVDCVAVNMRSTVLLHPRNNPSTGFMFLLEVIHSQLFLDHEIFLYNFGHKDMNPGHHRILWEKEHVDRLVRQKYFTQIYSI